MNPKSHAARAEAVRREVWAIITAWPEGQAYHTTDREHATVVIREPRSTYIIEVDPDSTRSLHVPHYATAHPPAWREGWVD